MNWASISTIVLAGSCSTCITLWKLLNWHELGTINSIFNSFSIEMFGTCLYQLSFLPWTKYSKCPQTFPYVSSLCTKFFHLTLLIITHQKIQIPDLFERCYKLILTLTLLSPFYTLGNHRVKFHWFKIIIFWYYPNKVTLYIINAVYPKSVRGNFWGMRVSRESFILNTHVFM